MLHSDPEINTAKLYCDVVNSYPATPLGAVEGMAAAAILGNWAVGWWAAGRVGRQGRGWQHALWSTSGTPLSASSPASSLRRPILQDTPGQCIPSEAAIMPFSNRDPRPDDPSMVAWLYQVID